MVFEILDHDAPGQKRELKGICTGWTQATQHIIQQYIK